MSITAPHAILGLLWGLLYPIYRGRAYRVMPTVGFRIPASDSKFRIRVPNFRIPNSDFEIQSSASCGLHSPYTCDTDNKIPQGSPRTPAGTLPSPSGKPGLRTGFERHLESPRLVTPDRCPPPESTCKAVSVASFVPLITRAEALEQGWESIYITSPIYKAIMQWHA